MAKKIGIESGLLRLSDVKLKYDGHDIQIFSKDTYVACFSIRTARLQFDGASETTNWYKIVAKNN